MIYFDNAATTPMLPGLESSIFGNPSSPHAIGIMAEKELENVRKRISAILNCNNDELIFTSGGTESNNLAILGFALANKRKHALLLAEPWEHPSILEPIKFAKEFFGFDACIAPRREWPIDADIRLACLSHVNNETGDVNDVSSIARLLKEENHSTVVHIDGAQGFCKEQATTDADMYSFSGHKCHAPIGTGGLVVRRGVKLKPIFYGGGQEKKLRPGTENVDGIVGMAKAASIMWEARESLHSHVEEIKNTLLSIKDELPNVFVNDKGGAVSPYILNISFLRLRGETLVHMLSEKQLFASMGAACRSRKRVKSTLEVMGFDAARAESAVRFSFSHLNTIDEAVHAKAIIIESVQQLRQALGK